MAVEILLGDMRDLIERVPDGSIDLAIVDPPYGDTKLAWDKRVLGWPSLVRPKLKRTGSMWVFGSLRMFLETAQEFAEWRMSQDVVWEKHNGTSLFADRFRRVHELAVHYYRSDSRWADVFKAPQFTNDARARVVRKKARPKHWIGSTGASIYRSEDGGPRLMRSVLPCRSEHGQAMHPTQKPLGFVEPLVLYACPPNGHILEVFAGSGPAGVLAQRHGFSATLIEADPVYARLARSRIDDDGPLLPRTGT